MVRLQIQNLRIKRNYIGIEDVVIAFNKKYPMNGNGYMALAESCFEFPECAYDLDDFSPSQKYSRNEKAHDLFITVTNIKESSNEAVQQEAFVYLALEAFFQKNFAEAMKFSETINTKILLDGAKDAPFSPNSAILMLDNPSKAMAQVKSGFNYVRTLSAIPAENSLLLYWTEACLFTIPIISEMKDVDKSAAEELSVFACTLYFENFMSETSKIVDQLKASSVIGHYISLKIRKLGSLQLFGIPGFSPGSLPKIPASQESLLQDIRKWLVIYEKRVTQLYPFPEGGEIENRQGVKFRRHQKVLLAFEWWVQVDIHYSNYGPNWEEHTARHYTLLETLYRGTTHAFHSIRLLRFISHTFMSLLTISPFNVCINDIAEAKKAVESYVFHWEKHFTLLLDAKKKEQIENLAKMANRNRRTSIAAYTSHRISGYITQYAPPDPAFPNPVSASEGAGLTSSTILISPIFGKGSQTNRNSKSSESVIELVTIKEVDGETVADVVGVLITGMRLLLLTYDGNVDVLKAAALYGEKAFIILTEHGTELLDYPSILSKLFQWLGVVYGELSLEVVGRKDRLKYQDHAVVMLIKASNLVPKDHRIRYQLALQLAENGDFKLAIDEVNRAITLSPNVPSYYNLLALMLSSKSQIDKALALSWAGWKYCIKDRFSSAKLENEMSLPWNDEDFSFREDLVNLRITIILLERKKYSSNGILSSFPATLNLLRKIIGAPAVEEDVVEETRKSKISASERHSTAIKGIHRFGTFNILITLWLTASSMYRDLGEIEKACHAVDEAEGVLITLSRIQHRIRNQNSKLFKDEGDPNLDSHASSGFWKEKDPVIARIQADVALEKAFVQYEMFKAQNKPKSISPFIQYLSPLARVQAERQASLRRDLRSIPSNVSINTFDSISLSQSTTDVLGYGIPTDHNDPANDFKLALPMEDNLEISLDRIIESVQFALVFDLHHLPARTFLGMLFREKGDLGQSEHHLQIACTQQNHRGSSSGRTAMPSIYGGFSSQWGWISWNQLAQSLHELGRNLDAQKAALYALQLEKVSCIRGYESLARFF